MDYVSQRSSANRPIDRPDECAPKKPNLRVWTNSTLDGPHRSESKLLRRLEAENAELRDKAVELLLQIQALRGGEQALTA